MHGVDFFKIQTVSFYFWEAMGAVRTCNLIANVEDVSGDWMEKVDGSTSTVFHGLGEQKSDVLFWEFKQNS